MIKLNNSNNILTKIEENERKKEWKRKLMLILAPISRFVTKKSPFASPSLLLLQSSSMEVWEKVWSYPMNHVCVLNQIHSPFKGKNKQQPKHNCVENEGSQKNRNNPGRGKATTAVATTTAWPWQPPRSVVVTTVGPWCPLAGRPPFVLRTVHFAFRLESWVACLGLFALGFLGLFSSSLA